MMLEKYNEKLDLYNRGLMNDERWNEFCMLCLEQLINNNKNILEKMQEEIW